MRNITAIFFAFVISEALAQNNITNYHLKGKIVQNYTYNPAEASDYRINISLPINVSFLLNNFASWNDVLTLNDTGEGYKLNLENALSRIEENEVTDININSNLFHLGIGEIKGVGVRFFASTHVDMSIDWPKNFLNVALRGNGGDNIGKSLKDDTNLRFISYNDIGMGLNKSFRNNKLTVGVNLKYLLGNAFSDFGDGISSSITTNKDTYDITLDYKNYRVRGLAASEGRNVSDYLLKGSGFSFDVGGTYDFKEETGLPLGFSLSILDILGSLSWNDVSVDKANDVSVVLDKDFLKKSQKLIDKIKPNITTSKEAVTFYLPTKLLASVSYDLTENDAFYLTSFSVFSPIRTNNTFALAYTRNLLKDKINITANVSKKTGRNLGFGTGVSMIFLGMQIYASSDNIPSFFNVSEASLANVNLGLNFVFGGKSNNKIQTTEEHPIIESAESIKHDKQWSTPSAKKPHKRNQRLSPSEKDLQDRKDRRL